MSTVVLMKAFESVPGRYDFGMRLITLGEVDRLREEIAGHVFPGAKVLDVGCGTGELLPLLANRGAWTTAIDKSPEMVKMAHERAAKENVSESVEIHQRTAMEVDRLFGDAEFDVVVLSLVMSELTNDERRWLLDQCARILKPAGVLLVADEFRPRSIVKRVAFSAIRLPLHLVAYLYTQIKGLVTTNVWWKLYYTVVELPLMLISFLVCEPLTRPLESPDAFLPTTLVLSSTTEFRVGSISLLKITKGPVTG